ncbi:MAG: Hsp20/alpha crystallin family protein [Chloroflexota bacterium]|nr:Hsp20/alpha crystallin family protein [Chloroflexota bacterium]
MSRSIVRWQPFEDLVSLRDAMDRLFEESVIRPRAWMVPFDGGLAVDVYETEDNVIVEASLPGVKPEEIDVSITGDVLTIKGETKAEKEVKEERYVRRERRYGSFCRSVSLPTGLKGEETEAEFENGILKLTVPKAEEVKPKVIKVKASK